MISVTSRQRKVGTSKRKEYKYHCNNASQCLLWKLGSFVS